METLTATNFRFFDFELDGVRRVLLKGGKQVTLNPKALDVLLVLVESRGQVLSKDELLERVWPGQFVEEGNLKVHVSALRKIFGESKNDHDFIVTVPGRGYSFVADIEMQQAELVIKSHRISKIVVADEEADDRPAAETPALILNEPVSVRQRTLIYLAAVIFLAAGIGLTVWYSLGTSRRESKIESIAVIPFTNESGEIGAEYLSDGLTDSVINYLSRLTTVSVKGASSVSRYKGKQVPPEQIGSELGVQAFLNGRVAQRGDWIFVNVSLVVCATGDQIWGEQYARNQSDLASLQSEISTEVLHNLRLKLSSAEEGKLAKNYTANSEAYLLYLKGRHHWNKRNPNDIARAIELFKEAIQLDPNYALAYAGLADAYSVLSNYGGSDPHETKPKARSAALKAVSLDDSLAEAHAALGGILSDYDHDFDGEERELTRAIELNPNYATARQWHGESLSRAGRHDEAIAEIRRALEIDPLSLIINRMYGEILINARRYDEGILQLKKTQELDTQFVSINDSLAFAGHVTGRYADCVEAFAKIEDALGEPAFARQMRQSFATGGWESFLREMTGPRRPSNLPLYLVATFHVSLRQHDQAFQLLHQANDRREAFILAVKVDPRLDPLRDDPRYVDLIAKAGY